MQFHRSLLFDLQEMYDLVEHAPEGRRILVLDGLVHAVQAERPHCGFLILGEPDRAPDQGYAERSCRRRPS